MSNKYDYPRLSTFVGGIVDPPIRALALSITSSVGYLKSLVTQSASYAAASQASSNTSQGFATNASASAASVTIIYNNFTSTYVGVKASDPQKSSLNNNLTANSFYIRSVDRHLRYVAAIDANSGAVTWQDAVVGVDPQTVYTAADGRYLSLVKTDTTQTVAGQVSFSKSPTAAKVTDWNSQQLATAVDVVSKIGTEAQRAISVEGALSDRITSEITRATAVEKTLIDFGNGFLSGSNSNGYWATRPDGLIEQWGRIVINASATSIDGSTINFPIEFGDANSVTITGNSYTMTSSSWTENVVMFIGGPNGKTCNVIVGTSNQNQVVNNNITVGWRATGLRATPAGGDPAPANNSSSGSSSGSTPTTTNTGTTSTGDPGNSGGGSSGGGGGGHLCPEDTTPVLLANTAHDDAGSYVPASQLRVGDYVWTQHEHTMAWGAFKIIQARSFHAELWEAEGYYRSTKSHPMYLNDAWTSIDKIGHVSGPGVAIALTVKDAHTFISLDKKGNKVLNHNIKANELS